ncbi:hypothetical protein DSO57_1014284 [Entomophthora muscae]|uniref:Uncharacterized protein n=1 Tax=Entomophthora muscae TaxID=34485 RepID=A0ACC2S7H0_9FUNG|nr:hypothetical protein DSO57_1014284 [Entomophthora muscae]
MSTIVTNQNPVSEEKLGQMTAPNNIAPEQKSCAIRLQDPANECPSCTSAIFCPKPGLGEQEGN